MVHSESDAGSGQGPGESPLRSEITEKKIELGATASLRDVLEALLIDAAETWKRIRLSPGSERYPYRHPNMVPREQPILRRAPNETEHDKSFQKFLTYLESPDSLDLNIKALARLARPKSRDLPSPAMARRMRIVVAELPRYVAPVAKRGPGSRIEDVWQILWLDACRYTATKIARMVRRHFDEARDLFPGDDIDDARRDYDRENPVLKRDRIWKIRTKAYDKFVEQIGPLN